MGLGSFCACASTKMAASSSPPAKKSRNEAAVLNGDSCTGIVNGKSCAEEAVSGLTTAEHPAVTLFREYIRIPSISRGDNYLQHYGKKLASLLAVFSYICDCCLCSRGCQIYPEICRRRRAAARANRGIILNCVTGTRLIRIQTLF